MRIAMGGFALLCATPVLAQTGTPLPVLPGYLSTLGCPSTNLSPCFLSNENGSNLVRGMGSNTTTSATVIIAAQASVKTYITGVQCFRSDSSSAAVLVTFSDLASTTAAIPGTTGSGQIEMTFRTPLVTSASTAFTFTAGTSISTIICNAQGYVGS